MLLWLSNTSKFIKIQIHWKENMTIYSLVRLEYAVVTRHTVWYAKILRHKIVSSCWYIFSYVQTVHFEFPIVTLQKKFKIIPKSLLTYKDSSLSENMHSYFKQKIQLSIRSNFYRSLSLKTLKFLFRLKQSFKVKLSILCPNRSR